MKIAYDDARCYQNLIYAVIARAMMDTFKVPDKEGVLAYETQSAFDFLFGDDVDIWLELVDIDAGQFKTKLKDSMFSDKCKINEVDKRSFKINFKRWHQKKNEAQLRALGYRV